jgi:2-methylaconitate isomerase
MPLSRIRAVFMRGGTSKALMFRAEDLPANRAEWDAIFLAAMGCPDPSGRNLDGMGGGLSSLNKVCVVAPSTRSDADVDYTFVQLSADYATVDYSGNCGNMSSAIGPFAVEEGLVRCPPDGEAAVRIHNTNTGKIIVARFPVEDGALAVEGDFALDGVSGTAAPIKLEFLDPGGAKTGALLPTGNVVDRLILKPLPFRGGVGGGACPDSSEFADSPHPNPSPEGEGLFEIEASCIDAANPCVFVRAADLGKSGAELPGDLEQDAAFLARMEAIRVAAAHAMGLPQVPSIPKVAMVAAPQDAVMLSGERLEAADHDITVRMNSVGQPHRAVPITGAICLAVAARVAGSIPHQLCSASEGPIRIGHASGTTQVDAEVSQGRAVYGGVYRTARRLFEGAVVY